VAGRLQEKHVVSSKTRGGALLRSASRWLLVLASLVALALVIAYMSGAFRTKIAPGEAGRAGRPLAGRSVVAAETLATIQQVDAVGTIEPRRKTDVASRMLATINDIFVNPGDEVEVGQLLCELDDREIQAQLREVEASAAGIEADLAVRQREYDRYQRMYAENAVTKEDLDRIVGAYQMAQAQLQRTLEQANRIKITLSYTQIKAQTAGVVADRYMDPGDLAVPGKPILTVHDPRELELHANVREGLSGKVRQGLELPVRIDALDRTMPGTIREIVPRAQAQSRSLLVKVTLPQEQLEGLFIGMFGRLSIPVEQTERLVVDSRAVRWMGQLAMVDVVGVDQQLERRFVCTGQKFADGTKIEILSGLAPQERVALPAPADTNSLRTPS
jgi:RND family efflux transporter MFP subunit